MFIKISKTLDKYYFEIGDSNLDVSGSFLSSIKDHCLIPFVPEKFSTFVEAHHYASEITENNPTIVLAKKLFFYKKSMEESGIDETHTTVNDKILECYGDQLSLIEKRFKEFESDMKSGEYKPKENKKILQMLKEEIEKITGGIEKIIDELDFSKDEMEQLSNAYWGLTEIAEKIDIIFPPEKNADNLPQAPVEALPPMPPGMPMSVEATSSKKKIPEDVGQILKAFGEAAVLGVNKLHPLSYIKSIYKDNKTDDYMVIISERNKNIIGLKFGNNLLLNEIIPLQKGCGNNMYTSDFLNKYWVPITYSVGHFAIGSSVITPSYNMLHKKIYGFNKNGKTVVATINVEGEDGGLGIKKSWWIKFAQENKKRISDFKQEELINAEVICIDKRLPTYYQRSGQVLSVIPRDDYIDLLVDFRRGLDKLILRDDQIDVVKLPS